MADAKNDHFPAPFQDQQQHDRTTPASMGGARPVLPPSPVRPPGRPPISQADMVRMRQYEDRLTRVVPIAGSGVVPASGTLVVDLGGPEIGYTWDLKQIMVGPEDMTVLPYATGVTVVLFLRPALPGNTDTTASNALSWTQQWPAQGTWGRHEANLQPGENVQAVIIGLPAGTVVTAGGTVEQTAQDTALIWSE